MNFNSVDIDLLKYVSVSEKIKDIKYNNNKRLVIWTPVCFIKKNKDSFNNEFLILDLEEYPKFLEFLKIINLHAMLMNDITEDNKDNFSSSLYSNKLYCKIPKKRNIIQSYFSIKSYNKTQDRRTTFKEIANFSTEKGSCCIYIDQIYISNDKISLKWKLEHCCVYRNDK